MSWSLVEVAEVEEVVAEVEERVVLLHPCNSISHLEHILWLSEAAVLRQQQLEQGIKVETVHHHASSTLLLLAEGEVELTAVDQTTVDQAVLVAVETELTAQRLVEPHLL